MLDRMMFGFKLFAGSQSNQSSKLLVQIVFRLRMNDNYTVRTIIMQVSILAI